MDREVSKEQQTRHIYDGTLMRFGVRPSPKLQNRRSISRRKLAFYLCSQKFPVQTNNPEAGCPRYAPHARSTGARTYRTRRHSLKLSLSESQVPVLIGTSLSAARSRQSEATPRSPALTVRQTPTKNLSAPP